MTNIRMAITAAGVVACVLMATGTMSATVKRNVATYERDDLESVDKIVSRGYSDIDDDAFEAGQLGVLLASYDRRSLYLAYRALFLGRTEVARQHSATPDPAAESFAAGGIDSWLKARSQFVTKPLPYELDTDANIGGGAIGKFVNCGDPAFDFAAETLRSLADRRVARPAIEEWVQVQDQVFGYCTADASALPQIAELPGGGNPYLLQLRQYQIATAYFYARQFDEAVGRFDVLAADRKHPLRAWAAHAAARAVVRKASLANPINKEDAAQANRLLIDRVDRILADKSLAAVHGASRTLKQRAALLLEPDVVYTVQTAALSRLDLDFRKNGLLGNWTQLGNNLFDYRGNAQLVDELRGKFEFFDWIRTIQGCTDNDQSPNYTGACQQEHRHALQMWEVGKKSHWLVASVMTSKRYDITLLAAFDAAKLVKPGAMEYLTLRYHMSRALRASGMSAEATELLATTSIDAAVSASADNLLRQERLALARSEEQALMAVLRRYAASSDPDYILGADGDELINRHLTSADQLRLATQPGTPPELRQQLLVAAWWRADMLGDEKLAGSAAQLVTESVRPLAEAARLYLNAGTAHEKHYLLARIALQFRISPQVGRIGSRAFASRNKGVSVDWWCSFDSGDFAGQARVQRVSSNTAGAISSSKALDSEMQTLTKIGSSADWYTRTVLQRAQTTPQDAALPDLLRVAIASSSLECASPASDALMAEARRALEKTLSKAPAR